MRIRDINSKCAQWLNYTREELIGKDLSFIWTDKEERERWISDITRGQKHTEQEVSFLGRDNQVFRFVISAMLETKGYVLCSAVNITSNKIVDEEIIKTLNDLEQQVKARTRDLEQINEKLRAEILECRRLESTILSGQPVRPKKENI
jgi:PAS domain-containing protein